MSNNLNMGSESSGGIGLLEAVAIEVGLIVGAGLFALTGVATDLAGPAVPVSYVVAFGVVALGLVPTAVLGAAYPTVAGNYRYPREFVSPHVAYLAAWGLTVSMFGGGLPLYALSFGGYVETLTGVAPRLTAVLALTFFFGVNLLGIRPAARVQLALFATLVASLLTFVVGGLPAVDPGAFRPLFAANATGVVTGAAVLYFVCLGANFIVDLGGDVQAATVTIPRSFLVSIPLALALYALVAFVAVGTVGPAALAGESLAVPAEAVLSGPLVAVFVVGGALFATATTLNAVFMIAPKYLAALAADDVFPAVLARENDRWGTPHWGLTVVYAVTVASALSPLPFDQLGSLLGFGGIFLIVPVMVAAIRFVRERPGVHAASSVPLSPRTVVAVAALGIPANVALFVLLGANDTGVLGVWVVAMVVGEAYYLGRRRYLARHGRTMGGASLGEDGEERQVDGALTGGDSTEAGGTDAGGTRAGE